MDTISIVGMKCVQFNLWQENLHFQNYHMKCLWTVVTFKKPNDYSFDVCFGAGKTQAYFTRDSFRESSSVISKDRRDTSLLTPAIFIRGWRQTSWGDWLNIYKLHGPQNTDI